jgi:hypothetical protein
MSGNLLKVNELVAREGVEPPTPAFSVLRQARWVAGDDLLRQIQFINSLFGLAA